MQQIRLGARLILYILRKLWGVCHFIIISFLLYAKFLFFFFCPSTRLNTVNHSFIDRKGSICITLKNAIHRRPTSLMKKKKKRGVCQAKCIAFCEGAGHLDMVAILDV